MPCRCDYMEPNDREIEYSKVLTLLDELDGKAFNDTHFKGWHPQAYGGPISQSDLDKATATLCTTIRKLSWSGEFNTKRRSFELLAWWRDHKAADQRHKAEDKARKAQQAARVLALSKLTLADRKALGI